MSQIVVFVVLALVAGVGCSTDSAPLVLSDNGYLLIVGHAGVPIHQVAYWQVRPGQGCFLYLKGLPGNRTAINATVIGGRATTGSAYIRVTGLRANRICMEVGQVLVNRARE